MHSVDVITIGAGGGAYPAAFRLAQAGHQVTMVDNKGVMSGNCLAEGCIPSKAVREVAERYRQAQQLGRFGVTTEVKMDFATVLAHKDHVQRTRYAQHAEELARLAGRLNLVKGRARFKDAHTVIVESHRGEETYRASHIIIASGADTFVPSLAGSEYCLTSRDLFGLQPKLKKLPKRLAVIGGGYIGLETASILCAFGVKVTLLEQRDQMLPGMDLDYVAGIMQMIDPAIDCITGADVKAVERVQNGTLKVNYQRGDQTETRVVDAVLMATGRRPISPEGADSVVGLHVERGAIVVDAALRTNVPHIYACGDVNGHVPLFHAAVGQSLVAAHNILGGGSPMDYFNFEVVPTTIFTLPAAAFVGHTRAELKARGKEVVETAYAFDKDSRAQILNETAGEIRLYFESGSLRLLGGWVLGLDAEHLIGQLGLAVSKALTAHDLAAFCNPHPMASEGISKAARQLF